MIDSCIIFNRRVINFFLDIYVSARKDKLYANFTLIATQPYRLF